LLIGGTVDLALRSAPSPASEAAQIPVPIAQYQQEPMK
jgi:hypothetical protein